MTELYGKCVGLHPNLELCAAVANLFVRASAVPFVSLTRAGKSAPLMPLYSTNLAVNHTVLSKIA